MGVLESCLVLPESCFGVLVDIVGVRLASFGPITFESPFGLWTFRHTGRCRLFGDCVSRRISFLCVCIFGATVILFVVFVVNPVVGAIFGLGFKVLAGSVLCTCGLTLSVVLGPPAMVVSSPL